MESHRENDWLAWSALRAKPRYSGVIIRIAYASSARERDHVDVRLTKDSEYPEERVGYVTSTYRWCVEETGKQECPEPDVRPPKVRRP